MSPAPSPSPQPKLVTYTWGQRLGRLLFVPSLILVALLSMYTRTTQVVEAVQSGAVAGLLSPAPAVAETAPAAESPSEPAAEKPAPDSPAAAAPADGGTTEQAAGMAPQQDEVILKDEDIAILQQLAERRKELDKREGAITQREALLQAAETKVEDKIAELQIMRTDLEKLLAQANTERDAQVESLVKIYQNMKPAQAAAIFEQLDMRVLLTVAEGMKERSFAPILAAMDPAKAKAVTTELMKRKELQKKAPPPLPEPAPSAPAVVPAAAEPAAAPPATNPAAN